MTNFKNLPWNKKISLAQGQEIKGDEPMYADLHQPEYEKKRETELLV